MLGYIDPGAGTIILQTLIAAILGVAIFFRNTVKQVFLIIFGRRGGDDRDSEGTPEVDEPTDT
jgi:hypothetical protein